MKILILTFMLSCFLIDSYGQVDSIEFKIDGYYVYNGKDSLTLGEVAHSSDNNRLFRIKVDSSGHFQVTGKMTYSRLFILYSDKTSKTFFVGPKPISLFITLDDLKNTIVNSSIEDDIFSLYSNDLNKVNFININLFQKYDDALGNIPKNSYSNAEKNKLRNSMNSLHVDLKNDLLKVYTKNYRQAMRFLALKYLENYPGSYAAASSFSDLVFSLDTLEDLKKYKEILELGKNKFTKDLINHPLIVQYTRNVNSIGKHKVGDKFPEILLSDSSDHAWSVNALRSKSKYTLVDFWASWCGPCIENLNKIKPIFKNSPRNLFNVMTISIDKEKKNWLSAAERLDYPWIQVWAEPNTPYLNSFYLNTIPLNYLLNAQGEILKINVTEDDILKLLSNENM